MRLKTQLVLAITALVFVLCSVISLVYMGQLLATAVQQSYTTNRMVANQLRYATQLALENGLQGREIAPGDAAGLRALEAQAIRGDAALAAMIGSLVRYSPTVYDVAIADSNAVAILSSDPSNQEKPLPARAGYQSLLDAGAFGRMRIVFGAPAVYEIVAVIDRNGQPFATVHVGVRTTLLRAVYAPWIASAFTLMGFALIAALAAAFFLGNFALRPLEEIAEQLDSVLPVQEAAEDGGLLGLDLRPGGADLAARVAHKIERVGQRVKNVEELYTALQGNIARILANLEDGLLLFSRDGRALLVSSAAKRFLGREAEALTGLRAVEIFDAGSELGRLLTGALDRHDPLDQQEARTAEGRRVQLSLQFVGDGAQNFGALVTLHDPETVEQIGSDMELSCRMAAIGRLTAGVGHEVKNPLNAIVLHLELLKNKLADPESPAQRHLGIIESEIHRLDRVVQLLAEFSRPMELHLDDHDLRGIASAVLELSSEDLKARGIALDARIEGGPVLVHADADLLKQAILNVVRNGAQAMEYGGRLTVVLEVEAGKWAVLRIADQGPGIAPEVREKIFQLYFTTKSDGSGIGLAMTYRILQLHHGSIEVKSELGAGAEFALRLPLAERPAERRAL